MLHWTGNLIEAPNYDAVTVGNKLYSFRWYGRDHINVYIFDTVSLRWTLPPVATRRVERPSEDPCKRWYHTAVLVEDTIYIWGGLTDIGYCKMLYSFDVAAHTWFKPKVYGTVPEGREGHSACVLDKVMFIHGGLTRLTGWTNDIYKLDTATMVWSLTNTRGTPPPTSYWHSATVIGTKMFVFGGEGAKWVPFYKSIRVFDTEINCWLNTPSAQPLPERRRSHSAFAYNGEIYIFGGRNSERGFNDLWRLNPETFSWKEVKPKGNGPLRMTQACCCMTGDRVILFGGDSDDLFILDLSPSLKTLCKVAVIQYGLDQLQLSHNIRWELAAMTDGTRRLK